MLRENINSQQNNPVDRYVKLVNKTQSKQSADDAMLVLRCDARYDGPEGEPRGYVGVYNESQTTPVYEFEQSPHALKQFYFVFCCMDRDLQQTIEFLNLCPEIFDNAEISPEYSGPDAS